VRDLIAINGSFTTVENLARARIRGVETALDAASGPLRFGVNLSVQDPKDADTGQLLARRARMHGTLHTDFARGPWRTGAELTLSGPRFDDAANTVRLPGYAVTNLSLAYAIGRDLAAQLRWDNVLDRKYELVRGYNTPASSAFLTLRYEPK
jgi:vitamin B12 transporter